MDPIAQAFTRINRTDFLPVETRRFASEDAPLSIGYQQTNSQPSTVKAMLKLLAVHPGHRVLDVGAGSGWSSALLGSLVGDQGEVIGVERIPELVSTARAANAQQNQPWVHIRQATDGELGAPGEAPFDRILVSAMANALPEQLVEQLGEGGVMVIPVAGEMLRVRQGHRGPKITRHGKFKFVPLRED
ncbi:protein-L-isoaspartate O-methyltransferase [Kocuria sp. cx-455]|uniref:protein-L-isoaspartate O-methyltransferase family protein n=1 Tax=unclassified Candidatus Sulfotelmatobacter TaxID=2635724 RepID=UPI00168308CD|nr:MULTISPECIES: protein-L-isoaspartate O-methyltransferase [unclassified Candidatus Sulfotelmatobacter]MBD2762493.1 protein-L-isoaspartate O-methyltransferase [Kocuria sp. cx-116]MBD2764480.1 protein-L-isoaspartate O-methyltransferase [Kocuria sp. cx-455]